MGVGKPHPGNGGPATEVPTTSDPIKAIREDMAHLVDHASTMMLASIESVQERMMTQVAHTPATKCLGSTVFMGAGSSTTTCVCGFIFLNKERAQTTPTLAGGKHSEG
jgi:hypothetical protein